MRRTGLLLVLIGAGGVAFGQALPGTFTAQAPQPVTVVAGPMYSAPLLTTPIVSFGSGLTPPVIVNGETTIMGAPRPSAAAASMYQQEAQGASGQAVSQNPAENQKFEYVIAPSGGTNGEVSSGVGTTDLGEKAAAMRKGPPPTQRTFTNQDIERMHSSSNYPMPNENAAPANSNEPNNVAPANPTARPQQAPQEKRSPFTPPGNPQ